MDEIEPLTIERIDDVPILLSQLERMQVSKLLDRHFPTHGNWQGLSLGTVSVVWLSHILSEGDHWLNHVEPWASQRLNCLQACLGQEMRSLDLSDDRLAAVLDYLSDDEQWQTFERDLSQHLIRVYDLHPRRVRVDSSTVSGYVHPSPDGLFQFGHSKDHRPDLPQVKIKLSALDPLGLPWDSRWSAASGLMMDGMCLPFNRSNRRWGRRGCCMSAIAKWRRCPRGRTCSKAATFICVRSPVYK